MIKIFKNLRISYVVLILALMVTETEIMELWQFVCFFTFFGLLGDVVSENVEISKKKKEKIYR